MSKLGVEDDHSPGTVQLARVILLVWRRSIILYRTKGAQVSDLRISTRQATDDHAVINGMWHKGSENIEVRSREWTPKKTRSKGIQVSLRPG
jgi:hypothetical protein